MIKEYKIGDNTFSFKGLKMEVKQLENYLGKITHIKSYVTERSGIIGGEIRETTFYVMFGQHELRLPEEFEIKKNQLFSLYHGTTIVAKDLVILFERIKSLFDAHVYLEDKTVTPEQNQIDIAKRNKLYEEAKIKQEKAAKEKRGLIDKLIAEYPYLKQTNDQESSRITATKNMRTELSREFPGLIFSITSKTFSGGDDIHVSWTDGATREEVKKITDKYQEGHFDGMEDIYRHSDNPFTDIFGGVKYVLESRSISGETFVKVAKEYGYTLTIEEPRMTWKLIVDETGDEIKDNESRTIAERIRKEANDRSFYIKPEKPVNIPGLNNGGLYEITYNPEKEGIEIKFPEKPSAEILQILKDYGFRWGKFNKVWYIRANRIPGESEEKNIYVANLIESKLKQAS